MAEAIRGSKANLQVVQDASGFERITQLLQWAALTFPKAAAAEPVPATSVPQHLQQQHQAGTSVSQPTSPRIPRSPFPVSLRSMAEDTFPSSLPRGLGEDPLQASSTTTPARHFSGNVGDDHSQHALQLFDDQYPWEWTKIFREIIQNLHIQSWA